MLTIAETHKKPRKSGAFVSFYLAEKLFDHLDGFNVGSGERHCDFWVYAFGDDVVD